MTKMHADKNKKDRKIFSPVEELARAKKYDKVIVMLLDASGRRLKSKYHIDKNHAWYFIGLAYYRQENHKKALPAFRKCIKSRPRDVQALFLMGDSYSELGKPVLAEKFFRKALYAYFSPLRPKGMTKYDIIYNLANSLFDQKRYGDAIELYDEIDNPDRADEASAEVYEMALKNKKLAAEAMNNWKDRPGTHAEHSQIKKFLSRSPS